METEGDEKGSFLSIVVPVDLCMQQESWVATGLMVFVKIVLSTHLTGAD